MKNILFSLLFGFVLILTACNNKEEESTQTTTDPATQTETSFSANENAVSVAPPSAFGEAQLAAPSNPGMQKTMGTPSGFNQGQQTMTTTVNPGQKTVTSPGMNPPHGEPGHRCEIAVGAPLDSKPQSTGAAQINASPSSSTPNTPMNLNPMMGNQKVTIDPAAPSAASTLPAGPTPEGMNPPHGEPGHDCAIEVGKPLKKK